MPKQPAAARAATTQTAKQAGDNVLARVLVDLPSHGAKCGQVLSAPDAVIASLADGGQVDPTTEAVAYAEAEGAELVTYDPQPEPAEEPAAAQTDGQ